MNRVQPGAAGRLRQWSVALGVLLCVALPDARPRAQERPLPDADAFLAEARLHLQGDSSLQSSYSYVETRRDQKLDSKGRVTSERVKVFENYPGLPGEARWERLISENGRPVPESVLAKQDRARQKKAEAYARRAASQPQSTYEAQLRAWQKATREATAVVDDVFRIYDIRMVGREAIDGHDTIAFVLTPRADAQTTTREGSIMRHFAARAWVSESDHELVRLEADAVETVPFGLGLVARMHKGSGLAFQRRKVNGEAWLPAVSTYSGSARVGLLKVIRRGSVSEYSNYRKFAVGTSETFDPPQTESP